ncbi:MAG TPA: sigma-70 family RNA polymerase sigma factor [Gemmatimonadales bacterium]|nr:sigma-70 family RNA polymerase sigma factor [Gemmatimonadales bacterium]
MDHALALPWLPDSSPAESAPPAALPEPAGDPKEAALLARVQQGQHEAFDAVVRAHIRPAYRIAYRLLKSHEDAEDLVQEAFSVALANIARFDLARPFAPWLYRIVVTRGLNRFRGRARHVLEALPQDLISASPDPFDNAERDEVGRAVQTALAELPERQRLIVQLFEIDGFTSEEIGAMLDLPAGTVRWHMHQARRTLRILLGPFLEARR